MSDFTQYEALKLRAANLRTLLSLHLIDSTSECVIKLEHVHDILILPPVVSPRLDLRSRSLDVGCQQLGRPKLVDEDDEGLMRMISPC